MKIRIKTASKEADIAILSMFRTQLNQIVALTYSAGMFIMLEQITTSSFSPLFPIDDQTELDKIFKASVIEKTIFLNIELEKISEEEMMKILDQPIYNIYYKKKENYFDLLRFESEALEASHNVFFQNFAPNLLVMQPVDLESSFDLNIILDRIHAVGMKNITKLEKEYLQRISKQE